VSARAMAEAASQVAERPGGVPRNRENGGGMREASRTAPQLRTAPWGGRGEYLRVSALGLFRAPAPTEQVSWFFFPFPQDLLLAAAFVSDAQYNRNIPFKTSPEAVR